MNNIKVRRAPILTRAGREIIKAKINFLIPFAPFTIRSTRPILNTLATRKSVGFIETLLSTSSRLTPGKRNYK
jgi:hypothetical protein